MRQSFVSLALALTFALSSSSLPARAAGAAVAYDLPELGPGGAAGIVFADALQQSSGWRSETPAALNLDPDGNLRTLLPGQTAVRTIYTTEAYPAGDYTLLYTGAGVFEIEGGSIVASSAGRATVRVAANAGAGLSLRLISTDAANPVRNVRLILPGYEMTYATQPFVPSYVRSLLGRNILRFAQWMHADTFVDSTFWTQRPRVTQPTQTLPDGVAPEYMILLANLTGASPWFTLPVGATDGYVYGFATLVHQTLDPRLHPIFQYGNEVWNAGTPGNGYAQMAAHNVGIPGTAPAAALSWYTRRSTRVLSVVRAAFGRDASRVTRIISGPAPDASGSAASLAAAVLRATSGAVDAFALPATGTRDLASASALVASSHLQVLGYAPQPQGAGSPLPASARPLGNAHLVLGTDLPASVERHGPPAPLAGASVSASLSAPDLLDLGGKPGVRGALGVPLPAPDLAAEGTLDWLQLHGSVAGTRTASAHQQLSAAVRSGGAIDVSAPADVREQILRVYVSVDRAQGKLTATLGSSTFADSSLSDPGGARTGVYTLVFRASSPGQRLSVHYATQASFGGSVALQGATLSATPLVKTLVPRDEPLYHNDLVRTGWNPNESTLTTANVATSSFKSLQTLAVDGNVLAQPLYLGQYTIAGAPHNVLIVATENDTVYEFDADSGVVLNSVSLGTSQKSGDVGCGDIQPTYGITSTPVVNRATGTLYVVSATEPSSYNFHTTLHALDIATLSDKVTPVDITASVTLNNGSLFSFDPNNQYNRPGLVWANNSLYVAIGSHCDNNGSNIAGWLLRYNASLAQLAAFSTIGDPTGDCDNRSLSSIWMSGFAPALDASGNLFVATGNGAFDANSGGHDYGESVLKLKPDLSRVLSYFTPSDYNDLNCNDTDFGSGGVMLLPRGPVPRPQVAVAMGKASVLYVLNSLRLGGESANDAGAVQVTGHYGNGVWGGPTFYSGPTGQFVYYQTNGDVLRAYQVSYPAGPSKPAPSSTPQPMAQLTLSSSGSSHAGYGGSTPVVSSNGQMPGTGIVWLVQRASTGILYLEAYDATNVSTRLFHGSAGTWSNPAHNGFVTPLVANGKVYVPSTNAVTVFGL